ncbi:hypothetical protein CFN78_18300 [Amycolatopsis antarctica]|uniref:Uncharacterized protein n=1 Tax=Amycolatopsis antarctica TaxID=1854586 RepID=A0A263D0A2_9PSEU|nr:DUF6480 family protein [Amycolatopsis antarctica]OZM71781.1 hypothetical protein CFN78_18300 [Amycolatopsis antarctica]
MTITPGPGPEPEDAPGLEEGGSVTPGDTPPDAGQTSGLSHPQPMPSRKFPIAALIVIGLLVLALVGFFLARTFELLS